MNNRKIVNLFYFGQFIGEIILEDWFRDGRVTGNKNIFYMYLGLIVNVKFLNRSYYKILRVNLTEKY